MADPSPSEAKGETSKPSAPKAKPDPPPPKGNAAFRAIGLPNFRFRLPSRNWLIFITVVSSWTGALLYDRRQKKKIQKKWRDFVSHIADEALPVDKLDRKVTIFLQAPPGDGLRPAREHFTEYVKPILNAGALDWDVVEARREGELRLGLAERIRRWRKERGEAAATPVEQDLAWALQQNRARTGVQEYDGPRGDIIIGRHAWKEYVRGLHEGWLGPLDEPLKEEPESLDSSAPSSKNESSDSDIHATADSDLNITPGAKPLEKESESDDLMSDVAAGTSSTQAAEEAKQLEEEEKKKKEKEKEKNKIPPRPPVPSAYNDVSSYQSSALPPSIPLEFEASAPVSFPHILGIRNTPIRMYRFLTRRHLADEIGRQVAAAVLATYRPYVVEGQVAGDGMLAADDEIAREDEPYEQQHLLRKEEGEWFSKMIKRKDGDGERVWLDSMVVDARIAARMRRFDLTPDEEERAKVLREPGAKKEPGESSLE